MKGEKIVQRIATRIFIVIFLMGSLLSQERYEITETDLLALDKLPLSTQISVIGISVGDSLEKALLKFKKKAKDIKFTGSVYTLDVIPDSMRIISNDNKTISRIILFSKFQEKLKGTAAEILRSLSNQRMRAMVENQFGPPDFVSDKPEIFSMYQLYYLNGFIFGRFMSDYRIEITKDDIETEAKSNDAKRPLEVEVILRPKTSESAGFRKALWGMNKAQVKETETKSIPKEDKPGGEMKGLDMLTYQANVAGMNSAVVYYFANDTFTRARYIILDTHAEESLYIGDYEKIKDQLTQKYGGPARDEVIWQNELFKEKPSEYGTALSLGHCTFVSEWYPEETIIQLLLRGDNLKIQFVVEYLGENFREFEKKIREKAQKDIW